MFDFWTRRLRRLLPALLVRDRGRGGLGRRRRAVGARATAARGHRGDALLRRELALHLDEHVLRERRRREPARAHVVARASRSSSTSSGRCCSWLVALRSSREPRPARGRRGRDRRGGPRRRPPRGSAACGRAAGRTAPISVPTAGSSSRWPGALLAVVMTSARVRAALTRPLAHCSPRAELGLAWGFGDARRPGRRDEHIRVRRRGRRRCEHGGGDRGDRDAGQRRHARARAARGGVPGAAVLWHVPVALAAVGVDGAVRAGGI